MNYYYVNDYGLHLESFPRVTKFHLVGRRLHTTDLINVHLNA